MKLISNTDFGKKIGSKLILGEIDYTDYFVLRCNYDSFLIKTLEKWMFVPCDEDGSILKEPKRNDFGIRIQGQYQFESVLKEYRQAKERCLFEGFEVQNTKDWIEFYGGIRVYIPSNDLGNMVSVVFRESDPMNKTIEDLVKYNPELTQNAIKKLEL